MLRSSRSLTALTLAGVCAAGALAQTPALAADREPTPAQWLERMGQALATRNYDGTFTHWRGGRVEMLRIIHRVQDGVVSERLASLDGSGRELIRTGTRLTCYLPDQRRVLVEQNPAQPPLVRFPAIDPGMAGQYDLRDAGHGRLNRHAARIVTVTPRDEFRYGYRLWIDEATAMPLKTQLCDAHGQVIEQIVFASLRFAQHIPDAAFRPEVSTAGFEWLHNDPLLQPAAAPPDWDIVRLPPGFRMTGRSAQTLPGSSFPVDQLVFTDGLASVSVFVERHATTADGSVSAQSAAVGSSSAFSTVVDGHRITAVGEVPPATVEFFATQFRARAPVAAAAPH